MPPLREQHIRYNAGCASANPYSIIGIMNSGSVKKQKTNPIAYFLLIVVSFSKEEEKRRDYAYLLLLSSRTVSELSDHNLPLYNSY